ncbi:HalOD1 output domain-containing protein [Halorussus salinisoli]|uniref:HalOD1 output domain-containing protein n=1 Tax=Halorussus salinisoli TaxID=2558242 RepID=UPI0010C23230|nr:HalOD1 output domain-containing protein [Halorussus salinisoli]
MSTENTVRESSVPASLSTRVCLALAQKDDVHPWESSPLYETLDPAVLEALEAQENQQWRLEFEVGTHVVVVTGDGTITVDGTRFSDSDLREALDSLNDRNQSLRRID